MPGRLEVSERTDIPFDDEESDASGASRSETPRSTASKRRRLNNGVAQSSESPVQKEITTRNGVSPAQGPAGKHQAGSIVRVKLTNFVTYTAAEFHLGPSLNMIIGPNGTGKSTLVCAICLGLGWSPKHLGRAKDIKEFIHHGKDEAQIEIELAGGKKHSGNPVIRCTIRKDKPTAFAIDGRNVTNAAVSRLCQSFSIQVDNLCQFLPQDRVAEFAGLSPTARLEETQRAAMPPEMTEWHERLKDLYKKRRSDQLSQETDHENLEDLKKRQISTKQEVELLKERQDYKVKIDALKQYRPVAQYVQLRKTALELKQQFKEAQAEHAQLEKDVQPLLQSTTHKKSYAAQIQQVIEERRNKARLVDKQVQMEAQAIKKTQEEIENLSTSAANIRKTIKISKKKQLEDMNKIAQYEEKLETAPEEYDTAQCNAKIRDLERQKRDLGGKASDLQSTLKDIVAQAEPRTKELGKVKARLENLGTREGRQGQKLQDASVDSFKAWQWIQENSQRFEGPVYGPPIVECSVKDARYVNAIEGAIPPTFLKAFTCTTDRDYRLLQDALVGREGLNLGDIAINRIGRSLDQWRAVIPQDDLAQYGLTDWMLNLLDGPDEVLSMLCETANIHRHPVTVNEISPAQYHLLENSNTIQRWTDKNDRYVVAKRYGRSTTSTNAVRPARYWNNAPADRGLAGPLQQRIAELNDELKQLEDEKDSKRAELSLYRGENQKLQAEIDRLAKEKADAQAAQAEFSALPQQIDILDGQQKDIESRIQADKKRLAEIRSEQDKCCEEKATQAVKLAKFVNALRTRHHALLEAELMLIEAESEVASLEEENRAITEKLNRSREDMKRLHHEQAKAKDSAKLVHVECKRMAENRSPEVFELHESYTAAERDLAWVDDEIEATRSRLELIRTANPNALREYEARQQKIEDLESKLATARDRVQLLEDEIKDTRERWEPELDRLVSHISGAFSQNFDAIGCAGEVVVHKDDDFDKWAIHINVKFRDNEPLQALDSHRQSGGERAVSTIFYLLSLQALAQSPFRVVDEINQGMDPRNERMVHKRLVDVACDEHTSQYFLITPKLLPNLNYDPRMMVHCIASGEFMPKDASTLNFQQLAQVALRVRAAA